MNLQVPTLFIILAYCRNLAFGSEADDFFVEINNNVYNPIKTSRKLLEPKLDHRQIQTILNDHDGTLEIVEYRLDEMKDRCRKNLASIRGELFQAIETYIKEQLEEQKENKNEFPKDCSEILESGNKTSGIYHIYPEQSKKSFPVWCDMTTKGGGWISILNRFDGSQDFFHNWKEYKEGFGELSGEHWLGLQHLHELTYSKQYELLVEVRDWFGAEGFARYSHFIIGAESGGYGVENMGDYNGNAGDSLHILGQKFSTINRYRGDKYPKEYIPYGYYFQAGWWFTPDAESVLTAEFIPHIVNNAHERSAITWKTFTGKGYNLKTARMLIRSTKHK